MELHGSDRRFGRTLSLNALALRVINKIYILKLKLLLYIIYTIESFQNFLYLNISFSETL